MADSITNNMPHTNYGLSDYAFLALPEPLGWALLYRSGYYNGYEEFEIIFSGKTHQDCSDYLVGLIIKANTTNV